MRRRDCRRRCPGPRRPQGLDRDPRAAGCGRGYLLLCGALHQQGRAAKKKEAENEGVVKADLDHAGIAANILAALGGKANVQKASCCATRLRFQLKDGAKVDEKALKSAGASGVIRSTPTACQVILGTQVRFVYEELQKLL